MADRPDKPDGPLGRLLKEAAAITIWEGIRIVLGLVFTASTLILLSSLLASTWAALAPYRLLITLISTSGGLSAAAWLYQRLNRFHPRFRPLSCEFLVLEKEITYEFRDREHIVYRKRLLLQALRQGLDCYHDKYHWTGDSVVSMTSAIQDQEVSLTVRKNLWQLYEIRFQRTLAKGEEIETEVTWELNDKDHHAVPFFSASIDEPTKKLRMRLSVPPAVGIRQAVAEVSSSIVTKKPLTSRMMSVDRNGMLVWDVNHPLLFHHYEVKWIFPHAAIPQGTPRAVLSGFASGESSTN